MNPTAGSAAIVFAFPTGACAALSFAMRPGPAALCFALAALVSFIACALCYALSGEKGRPR